MFELLASSPPLLIGVCALAGLLTGSFLNVVIHRLPLMMEREWRSECETLLAVENAATAEPVRFNLIVPRSRCPACNHEITALENVPVLSYLFLRGRCSGCGARISPRYPLIEVSSAVAAACVAHHLGFSVATLLALILTWSLIALAGIDFDTQLLPDSITQPLLWLGLIANFNGVFVSLEDALIGAIAGYLSLWTVYWIFKLVTGKEGMGYGDFKLLAVLGAWQGWEVLPVIIVLSSIVGAVIGIALMVFRSRDRAAPMPFGPFLAAAGWITLLWGDEIVRHFFHGAGAL